uniref:CSON014630 protein n=1 Tax=Culicoides sonorensis TaxID=179676 RepID=A0A336LRV4_CULSO
MKMKQQNNFFTRHSLVVGVTLFIIIIEILSTSINGVTGSHVIIPKIKQQQNQDESIDHGGVAMYKNELHAAPKIPNVNSEQEHIFGVVKNFNNNKSKSKIESVQDIIKDEEIEYENYEEIEDDDDEDYNADYRQNIPQQQASFTKGHHTMKIKETHEIRIKQGRIKGFVRTMHPQSGLKNVDQFLGIPYAEAPVGSRRFMPPGAPPLWQGLKFATKFAPVCPQTLPDVNDPKNPLSKGRYDQIKRLFTYLKNEDEDCLYLNVYVPAWDGQMPHTKLPVIVYIHGESYEWNSGNAYDGTTLASYGQVIVVTVNYRLGILGFLKPSLSENTVSNFGLLDQIAALQWIKDNIEAFGGDNKAVTLMGHSTGAACINFLMISPVAKGLFHRAILMSGSALSDWALTNVPLSSTVQVAQQLDCPIEDDLLLRCLREKPVEELMRLNVSSSEYSTRFGPIIDGLVIPNAVHKIMAQQSETFSRYDLLYGVTELESYHSMNAVSLTYGIAVNERDYTLKLYMQDRFAMRPDLALAATLKEYNEFYSVDSTKAIAEEHRDTLLEILSDARVTAPLVQAGLYLSKVNPRCYMYVFSHNTEAGEYARVSNFENEKKGFHLNNFNNKQISQSIAGEELAYVFGAPLNYMPVFQTNYNQQERLYSEALMKYWTNFAKTGNPKAPWRDRFLNMEPTDWQNYDVDWPEFNPINQSYLHLGITPIVSHRYRYKYMRFWNQELPNEYSRQLQLAPPPPQPKSIFPPPFIDFTTKYPPVLMRRTTASSMNEAHVVYYPQRPAKKFDDPLKELHRQLHPIETSPVMNSPSGIENNIPPNEKFNNREEIEQHDIFKSESTLTMLIGIVILFLIFNIFVIIGFFARRQMTKRKLNRKYSQNMFDALSEEKRSKYNETDDSYIMDIIRRNESNTYEAIKANRLSGGKGFILSRQLSSSTVDAHTKVTDWISQDMTTCSSVTSKTSEQTDQMEQVNCLQKPEKVNVAVDATPAGRGGSVLRQEPIELMKARNSDYGFIKDVIICQEAQIDPILEAAPLRFENQEDLTVNHAHSRSDPIHNQQYETSTSFISDINVTSRDENDASRTPLTPEESLLGIQRRNFPKVLPDHHPDAELYNDKSVKRLSLPPQYFLMQSTLNKDFNKIPPAPPPRISSTLGRRPSNNRTSTFMTSPIKFAEEPPVFTEPPTQVNTITVGPLVPKNKNEAIYMSMRRMNSIQENQSSSNSINSNVSDDFVNKEIPDALSDNINGNCLSRESSSNSDSSTASSTGTIKKVKQRQE